MTVHQVVRDLDAKTLTLVTRYPAPVAQVWTLWSDPRKLERWWGPPTYPATVEAHDLTPGGTVRYVMTGPTGDKHRGWWRVFSVEAPHRLTMEDGFADDAGNPVDTMPVTFMEVTLDAMPEGGTEMVLRATFPSREAMVKLIAMGMEEGLQVSIAQSDALLA